MAKASVSKSAVRDAKGSAAGPSTGSMGRTKVVKHKTKYGPFAVSKARFHAVMQAAEQGAFKESRGKVDPELKLGF